MNFSQFIEEGSKKQGNRLPLMRLSAMRRKEATGHAASKGSPMKAERGLGRKGIVKQPEGHPAAKRNQAYGGESEEQYNPPKYKAIKQELRDSWLLKYKELWNILVVLV